MTEQPMHAYAVSLVFGTGPIVANVAVAPSPEAAAAIVLHGFMREIQPKEELSGVAVVPIAPEWLGRAKDAVEGKERGQVLHLVPTPLTPSDDQLAAQQVRWCARHPMHRIIDGICALCSPPLAGGAA